MIAIIMIRTEVIEALYNFSYLQL